MIRVCLTNPTWRQYGERGIRAGCRVPNSIRTGQHTFIPFPFTLAYAMAKLEADGVPTLIIDGVGEDLDQQEYFSRVAAFKPDLIVNEMATQSHKLDIEIAAKLKDLTGVKIAVCGPHPTAIPAEILAHKFIDFVLLGEYEQTLSDLAKTLNDGLPLSEVKGLAYRLPSGQLSIGAKRDLIADLDSLPFPHRETLPLDRYSVGGFPAPVLYMYASRGCPYLCTFCVWPQWFRSGSYRVRSPQSVVDEIEHAQKRWGPFRSIYFDDDTFNIGKPRMKEMADEFKKRSLQIPWGCNARPDLFDEEMMQCLAEVGLFTIRIGVESADPEVLKRTKKNLDLSSVAKCIDLAHRFRVKVHVTFTIGLSGETWDSVERTACFAKSLAADSIAFTVTTPFPGTSYYDEVVRDGYLKTRQWEQFNVMSNSVVRTATMSSEEILKAEKYVMRKVYRSPQYLMRRLRYASSPSELSALAKKGVSFVMGRF